MNALEKEIALVPESCEVVETIYFGGGTPSLLQVEEIDEILKAISKKFKIDEDAEVTLEANPDDVSVEKLSGWKFSGINRLSLGIQSFFNEDLLWMNRAHDAGQAKHALETSLTYFSNITIDLIYGMPGLTHEKWNSNVQQAIDAGVNHLSCYALTVEPKTPLEKLIRKSVRDDIDAGQQSEQFLLLMEWMAAAGYEHYEISNFAKPGFRSRHNASYWQGKKYIGLGPGAHSYDGESRFWNIANNQKYIDALVAGMLPRETEILNATQKANEYIMTSLRTMEGLGLNKLTPAEKYDVLQQAQKFIGNGRLVLKDDVLYLTNEGKLFADGISADLFLG